MSLLNKRVFLVLLFGVSVGLFLFYAECAKTYAVLCITFKGGVIYEGASPPHESC
jgi:hypothetical protein